MSRPQQSTPTLIEVVRAAVAAIDLREDIEVEFDVPESIFAPVDAPALRSLVGSLLRQACQAMPGGGEVTLTAWQSADACELEIADTGPALETRQRQHPLLVAQLGGQSRWQNCPQGGAAITLRFPQRLRRAA